MFISHSSIDTWIAKQIAAHIHQCGAASFLDEADIEHGDDFEKRILEAANSSDELIVLLTPWATTRPYIWLEMGVFWGQGKRIVAILQGMTAKELAEREGIPVLLKRLDVIDINNIDSYFLQLKSRVEKVRFTNE